MNAMVTFLSNYGTNLKTTLLLWPFASFMLTLPILAYLYHRDGRMRFTSVVATYLAVLYLLGIACFTLWPLPEGSSGLGITYGVEANFNPLGFIGDIQKDGMKAVFQILFNIVFFVPLGFIAGRLLRMRLVPTMLLALGVSALVEIAQYTGFFGVYAYAYRCCDVDDLLANTLGGVIGWWLAHSFSRVTPQKLEAVEITTHPGFLRRCVALWIDVSIIYLGAQILWGTFDFLWSMVAGDSPQLYGLGEDGTREIVFGFIAVALFVLVEAVVPWRHGGCTLGGAFVRMTCESHPRTKGNRTFFYVMRTITLAIVVLAPSSLLGMLLLAALAFFYPIKHCMPYDLVP